LSPERLGGHRATGGWNELIYFAEEFAGSQNEVVPSGVVEVLICAKRKWGDTRELQEEK